MFLKTLPSSMSDITFTLMQEGKCRSETEALYSGFPGTVDFRLVVDGRIENISICLRKRKQQWNVNFLQVPVNM